MESYFSVSRQPSEESKLQTLTFYRVVYLMGTQFHQDVHPESDRRTVLPSSDNAGSESSTCPLPLYDSLCLYWLSDHFQTVFNNYIPSPLPNEPFAAQILDPTALYWSNRSSGPHLVLPVKGHVKCSCGCTNLTEAPKAASALDSL